MTGPPSIEGRVGALERDAAEIKGDIRGLRALLIDIKEELGKREDRDAAEASRAADLVARSRPSWATILTVGISVVVFIAGAVLFVSSIRSDVTRLDAYRDARTGQIERMQQQLDRIEDRQWREHERDKG